MIGSPQDVIKEVFGDTQSDRRVGYQQLSDRADPHSRPDEPGQSDRPIVLAYSRGQEIIEANAIDHEVRLHFGDEPPSHAHDVLALRSRDPGIDDLDPPSLAPQQALELTRIGKPFLDAIAVCHAVPENEHPEQGRILRGRSKAGCSMAGLQGARCI